MTEHMTKRLQGVDKLILSGDRDEWSYFLVAYRKLMTPAQLLNIWAKLIAVKQLGTRKTAFEFIDLWIEQCKALGINDFTKSNLKTLAELAEKINDQQTKNEIKLRVVKTSAPTLPTVRKMPSGVFNITSFRLTSVATAPGVASADYPSDILSIPCNDLAAALTVIDFKLFSKVKAQDVLQRIKWDSVTPRDNTQQQDNIGKYIDRFNEVSLWVATEILQRFGKSQQKCLQKFIEIASRCEKMNNFNTMWAIVSGLNTSSVSRLRTIWDTLSERHCKEFEDLETLMNPEKGFRVYIEELKTRPLPTLPYFGLFLRDLVLNNENPLVDDQGQFDIGTMKTVATTVKAIQQYQTSVFSFADEMSNPAFSNLITMLETLTVISDDEQLYQMSLQAEPSLWSSVFETGSGLNGSTAEDGYSSSGSEHSSGIFRSLSSSSLSVQQTSVQQPQQSRTSIIVTSALSTSNEHKDKEEKEDSDSDDQIEGVEPVETQTNQTTPQPKKSKKKHSSSRRRKVHKLEFNKPRGVTVPPVPEIETMFAQAEGQVDRFFGTSIRSTDNGTLHVHNERYILLRAESLSVNFFETVTEIFSKYGTANSKKGDNVKLTAQFFLSQLGFALGNADCKVYSKLMNTQGHGWDLLAAGPVHFNYSGWAFVNLRDGPDISPFTSGDIGNDGTSGFTHPFSFEANAWKMAGKTADRCACFLGPGYASGWVSASSGKGNVMAIEVTCVGKGDEVCSYIMAPMNEVVDIATKYMKSKDYTEQQIRNVIDNSYASIKEQMANETTTTSSKKPVDMIKASMKSFVKRTTQRTISKRTSNKVAESMGKEQEVQNVMQQHQQVQQHAKKLFETLSCDTSAAKVNFKGRETDRYIFIRAKGWSSEFYETVQRHFIADSKLAMKFGWMFLSDLGRSMGLNDQKQLVASIQKTTTSQLEPMEKLAVLPVNLAHTGFGVMVITNATMKDKVPYVRFIVNNSCEAECWQSEEKAGFHVCVLLSGYVSGWLSGCFGGTVTAVETSCRANGGACCEFLASTNPNIESFVKAMNVQTSGITVTMLEVLKARENSQEFQGLLGQWLSSKTA